VSSRTERPGRENETGGSPTPASALPETRRPGAPAPEPEISVVDSPSVVGPDTESPSDGFLSASPTRARLESVFVRLIATAGVIAVGTALGAALVANEVVGWIVGLVVSTVCVLCAAILWRSRQM
jgi:hypothetical protein